MPFPGIKNLSKKFIFSNFYQKICKKCANSTKTGHFKTIGDKKGIEQTPHEI